MKKFALVCSAIGAATAGWAQTEYMVESATLVAHYDLGSPYYAFEPAIATPYSNIATSRGQAFANGGAVAGTAPITRLVMDDITPVGGFAGQEVTRLYFSVANVGSATINARVRLRWWKADGVGGDPGSYYSDPAAVGFTFFAMPFPVGISLFFFDLAPGTMNIPSGTMWFGTTFDNNANTTGATPSDLNDLGVALFDPPTVGSSADTMFLTTAPGSYFGLNNPAGSRLDFGGNPKANVYYRLEAVPEPASLVALALGLAAWKGRRRSR